MQIVLAPNDILRKKGKFVKKITPETQKKVSEMIKLTQTFTDPEGVGLAAPQVGIPERYFIAKFGQSFQVFFNPQIKKFGKKEKVSLEGCLSIPDYYGEVSRPTIITLEYMDKSGKVINKEFKGVRAMIVQHEYDHLEGKLFIDYVLSQKGKLFKVVGKDENGRDIFEEVSL